MATKPKDTKLVTKNKKLVVFSKQAFEYSLALICIRVDDANRNGLQQYRIAKEMGIGPTTLSNMLNFLRLVGLIDISDYCRFKGNKSTADDYIEYGRLLRARKDIRKLAAKLQKTIGRRERMLVRKELYKKIHTFVTYERKETERRSRFIELV